MIIFSCQRVIKGMGFLLACLLFCVIVCSELVNSDAIQFDLSETDFGGVVPELSREDVLRALREQGTKEDELKKKEDELFSLSLAVLQCRNLTFLVRRFYAFS
jgi:hypothetical protein